MDWSHNSQTRSPNKQKMPQMCTTTGMEEKTGSQKKTWLVTVKSDLEPIGGFRKYSHRWNRPWNRP